MNKSKLDLYQFMDTPTGKEKCAKCGHSAFKSHKITYRKNKFKPIKAKCKYCKCSGVLSIE